MKLQNWVPQWLVAFKTVILCLAALSWKYRALVCAHKMHLMDSPGGPVVKTLPANAGVTVSIPGLGRSHMWQSN